MQSQCGMGRGASRGRGQPRSTGRREHPDDRRSESESAKRQRAADDSCTPSGDPKDGPSTSCEESNIFEGRPKRARRGPEAVQKEKKERETRSEKERRCLDHVRTKVVGISKTGEIGTPVQNLIANFYRVRTRYNPWTLFNFKVEFDPPQEVTHVKYSLVRAQAQNIGGYVFNGENLFSPTNVMEERVFESKTPGGSTVKVTLKPVGQIDPDDIQYLVIYSLIIRNAFRLFGLTQMGRHFYDSKSITSLEHRRLNIWPGFTTAIRNFDGGIMLNLDVRHRVLRRETCTELMDALRWNKDLILKEIGGSIVMTQYNQRTYMVHDIDWSKTPESTFEHKNGTETTFMAYYQEKFGIEIQNRRQPVLVVRISRKNKGQSETICLIPELCHMTGLSENQRKDFGLMREVANVTSMDPQRRVHFLDSFMQRLNQKTEATNYLRSWNMKVADTMLDSVPGRLLSEKLTMRHGKTDSPREFEIQDADWTNKLKLVRNNNGNDQMQMYSSVNLLNWAIITPNHGGKNAEDLLRALTTVSKGLKFTFAQPSIISARHDQRDIIQGYLNAIPEALGKVRNCQLLFFILPSDDAETYGKIKFRCNVEYGVRSQCMLAKHFGKASLMSVVTKITVQVNAKLGGEPWVAKNPYVEMMVVGFESHRGGKKNSVAAIGAMVATTNATLSQFYSTVSVLPSKDQPTVLSQHIGHEFKKCLRAFQTKNNNILPSRIFMYRGSVGEGSLEYLFGTELKSIQESLDELYGQQLPKLTFIIVTKKGNARIMVRNASGIENPKTGTIVDGVITIPERFDFFLVSQNGRQGQTVSPTTYNVISTGRTPAQNIQLLTYRFCHLYYNWSGTVSIPFVSQYAHKLAYLTGTAYTGQSHVNVNENLAHSLYFL